jgi:tetratricopeptide (TPR) repeat protein
MRTPIIAIVVVLLISGCDDKESRQQAFLLRGNEELSKGDDDKALYYYNEALQLDSCFADALSNIGKVEFDAHRYSEAIASYSKALECKPDRLDIRMYRAGGYCESREYYKALEDVDFVIRMAPDSAPAYFLRGIVLTDLAKYEESIKAFENALARGYKKELDCRINIATSKVSLKRFDEAKSELEACLKIDDKQPSVYNSLALIDVEKNELNDALKQINKAIELDPKHAYFINNRGFIEIQLGKLSDAEKDINESITMDPYNSWAYRNKGLLELKKNNYSEAERLLRKAKEMDPRTERVDEYLAMIPKNSK